MVRATFLALGGVLIAIGIFVAGICAAILGPDGWSVLRHAGAFQSGTGVTVVGVLMTLAGLLLPDHRPTIPAGHLASVRDTLQRLQASISSLRVINYGDADDSERRRRAFRSHFRRSRRLRWQLRTYERRAASLQKAKASLRARITQQASVLGIQAPDYDARFIINGITATTVARAEQGQLDFPFNFGWNGSDVDGGIHPGGTYDYWLVVKKMPAETLEDWKARVATHTEPIESLFSSAQMWDETIAMVKFRNQALPLQRSVAPLLRQAMEREIFRTVRRCPVCRDNR